MAVGASNDAFAEATVAQSIESWVGSHVRAFTYFEGVPGKFVPDNLKAGVPLESRSNLGQTSLTFGYEIFRVGQSHLVGSGQTVYAAVEKNIGKKIQFPPLLKERLTDHPSR